MDKVFVFPNIIRFSWGTIDPFFEKAVKVKWPHEKELDKVGDVCNDKEVEGVANCAFGDYRIMLQQGLNPSLHSSLQFQRKLNLEPHVPLFSHRGICTTSSISRSTIRVQPSRTENVRTFLS